MITRDSFLKLEQSKRVLTASLEGVDGVSESAWTAALTMGTLPRLSPMPLSYTESVTYKHLLIQIHI